MKYDSWLTVGITTGDGGSLSTIGIDFSKWDATNGITNSDCAVFWMDPRRSTAVAGSPIVLGQITVATSYVGTAKMTLVGRQSDGTTWREDGIEFFLKKT